MRKKWIWVTCLALFLMVGCASHSYFGVPSRALYVPDEFGQTETAIANAEKSNGAKYCPEMITKAKALAKQGVETYWACDTAKCMDLLAQARQLAKDAESCKPAPVAAISAPNAAPAPAPKEVSLKWVYFASDKSTLTPKSRATLDETVQVMTENPDLRIELAGYTDAKGNEAYNKALSKRRVKSVGDYLTSKGIAASRLTTVSLGKSAPVASNDTAEGRSLNRRVEVRVLK